MKLPSLIIALIFCICSFCFGPLDPNNPFNEDYEDDTTRTSNPIISDSTMLAYWNFNETEGIVLRDLSEFKSDGVLNGGKWVRGIKDSALYFNGISDNVTVNKTSHLNLGLKDFTISLFFKASFPENTPDSTRFDLISKGEYGSSGFAISVTKHTITGQIANRGWDDKDSVKVTDGKWHHVVLTRRSGKGYLYFDKEKKSDFACNDSVDASSVLKIGSNSTKQEAYFPGYIDEIKIVKKAWSESQIEAEYNRCF